MEELTLNQDLYYKIANWMTGKYALTTKRQRLYYLRKLSKKHLVLNKETLRDMKKGFKYQHHRAVISMINDYCVDENIDFYIRVPKLKKKREEKYPELLSSAEIKKMIECVPKPYDLAIRCIFNFGAGLRISEIIKLSWNDISWVDWLDNKDNYGVVKIKASKGSKDRVVNIPKKLMNDLYAYAVRNNTLNEFRIPIGGMIFSFSSGRNKRKQKEIREGLIKNDDRAKAEYVLTRYNWFRYNIIQKCCEKALGKRIKIHSLRHSRATYLYEIEKVPIERIQILLGHSSINTTMIYTHVNPISTFNMLKETKEI